MFKNGLIIGKFWPPHLGHQSLWEEAAKQCEHLLILVEQQSKERVSVDQRASWAQETMKNHPHVEIRALRGAHPQHPDEHPTFWIYWHNLLSNQVKGPIDALFANETYGETLAKGLGAQWVHFDMPRSNIPICATLIRGSPWDHWHMMQTSVRKSMVRRILILGAESTGKSVLTRRLAQTFGASFVPELAEDLIKDGADPGQAYFYQKVIEKQNKAVNDALELSGPVLFQDSNAITSLVFQQLLCPNDELSKQIREIAQNDHPDAVLLLSPDGAPYIHDDHRAAHLDRQKTHSLFKTFLIQKNIPFFEISGSFDEREIIASAYVNGLIHAWKQLDFETWYALKNFDF